MRMRHPYNAAFLSLLWGTSQELFGVSGSGIFVPWQWTDIFLGTPPKMPEPDVFPWLRQFSVGTYSAYTAHLMKHGKLGWEYPPLFGRNPLLLWRGHEPPRQSASRLRRMQEKYYPLVQEYLGSDRAGRKQLLDAWIPAVGNAELEAKLKHAIEEQWRLEIAPGQKNDPDRLPRYIREGRKIVERDPKFFLFGEGKVTPKEKKAGDGASTDSAKSPSGAGGGFDRIRDLERTFGFGYQLLRSCAVDGYELPYFREHVEKEWVAMFRSAYSSLQRTLRAMKPPPEAGPDGDKMGEESLLDYPPSLREEVRRDRQELWRERMRVVSFMLPSDGEDKDFQAAARAVQESSTALLGPWAPEAAGSHVPRSILNTAVNSGSLNELDAEQQQSGERLSLYPEGLTLAEKLIYRARRHLIEGERQTEDLRINAGEEMQLLQSALLPFAYSHGRAYKSPVGGATLDQVHEIAGDLNWLAGSENLSPEARAVAKYAAVKVIDVEAGLYHPHQVKVFQGKDEIRPVLARSREIEELESNAGNACVRLFAWAKRHQLLSRMMRRNLAERLKVLASVSDGREFGGGLSLEDLVEREMPTAVGPVTGKSGSPLALKENQSYTSLFYLLRDNIEKKLEEVPPVTWEDFDNWAEQYPELVRKTPWDKGYVPPWEWPSGVPPDRRPKKGGNYNDSEDRGASRRSDDDDSYYRSWFVTAVTGIAGFTLGLVIVLMVLILECRRSAALQRRSQAKGKVNGVGQEQSPEPDRQHSGAQPEQQQGAAPACSTPKVRPAAGEKEDGAQRPACTRTADYRLYVRDQQPQPRSVLVPGAIDPGVPHDPGPAGRGALRGHPLMMQPLVQEWQAVMGLQLHSHSPEVDGGQGRLLPPPVNPHAPAGAGQGDAAGQPAHERAAATSQSHLDSPPLPGQYSEVERKLIGAIGLVVPDGDTTSKDTLRAPPNSRATGASETEGAPTSSCAGCAV